MEGGGVPYMKTICVLRQSIRSIVRVLFCIRTMIRSSSLEHMSRAPSMSDDDSLEQQRLPITTTLTSKT